MFLGVLIVVISRPLNGPGDDDQGLMERELFWYCCLFFRNRVLHYVTSRRATRTHVQCIYRHVGYNFQTIKIFQLLKLNFDRFLVGIALINARFSENRLRECQCQELSEVLQQSSREPGCSIRKPRRRKQNTGSDTLYVSRCVKSFIIYISDLDV